MGEPSLRCVFCLNIETQKKNALNFASIFGDNKMQHFQHNGATQSVWKSRSTTIGVLTKDRDEDNQEWLFDILPLKTCVSNSMHFKN